MKNLEILANKIFAECEKDGEPVTKAEAMEMAKMEIGEKQNRRYEKSDTPRKKSVKVRKVDETKKHLLNAYRVYLEGSGAVVEPLKNEAEMHFTLGGDSYTVKLIKHRPPKN